MVDKAEMDIYRFRLVLGDPIDDDGAGRLFEAGVDDGYLETGPAGHSIGFDRESISLEEAVVSAIAEVESAGFEVLKVEPDELVSAADIAERVGRSRQSVSSLISGGRGPGHWPRPVAGNVRSPLWRWSDVAAWFQEYDGSQEVDMREASFLAATNEVLAARRSLRRIDPHARRLLRALASKTTASPV